MSSVPSLPDLHRLAAARWPREKVFVRISFGGTLYSAHAVKLTSHGSGVEEMCAALDMATAADALRGLGERLRGEP